MIRIIKKLIGLLLIGACCFIVLHPAITAGVTIYIVIKAIEILLLWGLANLISKLLFGVSIKDFLFDDDDD